MDTSLTEVAEARVSQEFCWSPSVYEYMEEMAFPSVTSDLEEREVLRARAMVTHSS